MTQSLIIDPNEVRRPGHVKFPDVPVNQYTFDRDTEIARYGEKGMVQMLHDMIVVRTDGSPTYNFAVVCDDANMGVTHVIRGDDHLSNTPRQILIPDLYIFRFHISVFHRT